MSAKSTITTYSCFFGIIILFLYLGYSSIANIKSTKLDPETYYVAKFINKTSEINQLAEELYKIVDKKHNINPNIVITITNHSGEKEELTQYDIIYNEIEKKQHKNNSLIHFLEKFKNQEFSSNYDKAIKYYEEATTINDSAFNETLNIIEDNDYSPFLIPEYKNITNKLGPDANKVKYCTKQATNNLKH
ncbi:MAG: hypothetical protein AB7V50_04275 [Vampirovibrionia bacterium]